MKTTRFAVVAICGTLLSTAAVFAQVGPAPMPTPVVGDVAKYRTIDLWNKSELRTTQTELVEIQADRMVTRDTTSTRTTPRTSYFTREWQPCRSLRDADQPVCAGALSFPMQVGNKHRFEKLPWSNGEGHSSGDCEVAAAESITVPAGTFDTLKLECSGYWTRVFGGTFVGREKTTIWYAPKISWIARLAYTNFNSSGKLDTQELVELVEFTRK